MNVKSPYRRERPGPKPPWHVGARVELLLLAACGVAIALGASLFGMVVDFSRVAVVVAGILVILGGAGVAYLLRSYGPSWTKSAAVVAPLLAVSAVTMSWATPISESWAMRACRGGDVDACRACRYHSDRAEREYANRAVCESGDLGFCVLLLGSPDESAPFASACRVLREACSGEGNVPVATHRGACGAMHRSCPGLP